MRITCSRGARKAAAGAVLACAALLTAACGSAPSSSTASLPGTSTRSAAAAMTARVAPCSITDLRITTGPAHGTSTRIYQLLDFKNTASTACTLHGYPVVYLVNAGWPLPTPYGIAAAGDNFAPVRTITLRHGATRYALLEITDASDYPMSACAPVQSANLSVSLTGQPGARTISYQAEACTLPIRQLHVSAFMPTASL